MIHGNLEEVICILKDNIEYLISNYDIKLVYIFGSYAKGSNNKNSDLDIAVLLNKEYNPTIKVALLGDLNSIFKRDDIDLVILNSSNSVLSHQVIKYGKIAYEESEDIKVEFEVRVLREYMDMEYFRKVQMEGIDYWIKNNMGV